MESISNSDCFVQDRHSSVFLPEQNLAWAGVTKVTGSRCIACGSLKASEDPGVIGQGALRQQRHPTCRSQECILAMPADNASRFTTAVSCSKHECMRAWRNIALRARRKVSQPQSLPQGWTSTPYQVLRAAGKQQGLDDPDR